MEEQKNIIDNTGKLTDRIVMQCWLFLSFMYILVFITDILDGFRGKNNRLGYFLVVTIFICIMPVLVSKLYKHQNAFVIKNYKVLCSFGFLSSFTLGFTSCYGHKVYPYAILIIMIMTLYQHPKYVLGAGIPALIITIGDYVIGMKNGDDVDSFSITMVFICWCTVTLGL